MKVGTESSLPLLGLQHGGCVGLITEEALKVVLADRPATWPRRKGEVEKIGDYIGAVHESDFGIEVGLSDSAKSLGLYQVAVVSGIESGRPIFAAKAGAGRCGLGGKAGESKFLEEDQIGVEADGPVVGIGDAAALLVYGDGAQVTLGKQLSLDAANQIIRPGIGPTFASPGFQQTNIESAQ